MSVKKGDTMFSTNHGFTIKIFGKGGKLLSEANKEEKKRKTTAKKSR